jgi:hypothetical protein
MKEEIGIKEEDRKSLLGVKIHKKTSQLSLSPVP